MFWNKKEDKKSLPDLPPYRSPGIVIKQSGRVNFMPTSEEQKDIFNEEEEIQKHGLPSFPDSLNERGFSQAAIKDAVSLGEENALPEFPANEASGAGKQFKTVEMEEWAPSIGASIENVSEVMPAPPMRTNTGAGMVASMATRFSEPPRLSEPPSFTPRGMENMNKNADIFVKLEKFYSARKALIDAQQKLTDIDELLKRIRETKMKEEHELNQWENEVMSIKARMNEITANIFEKVD